MNSHCASPEPLESRIAPALAFALDANNTLISFDLSAPDEILSSVAITGLGSGETLLGMDLRPNDGRLYGISSGQALYVIDAGNGQATLVAALLADPADDTNPFTAFTGSFLGVDFNPTVDRLRVTTDAGENLRINPNNGLVTTDGSLAYGSGDANFGADADVTGAAYTNSFSGATSTTLFGLDTALDVVVLINPPNNGVLVTLGALGVNADAGAAFDIAPDSTTAFAVLTVGGTTGLYSVNLGSGAATLVGSVGTGSIGMRGFAIVPGDLTLLNDNTASYIDADGDRVTVKLSKGELNANDFRLIARGPEGAQLATLNLADDGGEFAGAKITVKAAKPAKGSSADGFVNVGEILADVDLGKVKIDGDLGRILAGDNDMENNKGVGLAALQAHSLGVYGTETGAQSILTTIQAELKSLRIKTDVAGSVAVSGVDNADIGSVRIGGSLSGGDEANSGRLSATGDIGPVKIGKDIRGGEGSETGKISAGGTLASLKVGGSILGGTDPRGTMLAQIQSGGDMGSVKIGQDLVGRAAPQGGAIVALGALKGVQIGGNLIGGDGERSGHIAGAEGISSIRIKGSVIGGDGFRNASISSSAGSIRSLQIGGALLGGEGDYSEGGSTGQIFAEAGIAKLKIGEGIVGGDGTESASIITNGEIGQAVIGGSVVGGGGVRSAILQAAGYSQVRLGGSLAGGDGFNSGAILSEGDVKSVAIKGSLLAGEGTIAPQIFIEGLLGKASIGGDLLGSDNAAAPNGNAAALPRAINSPSGGISADTIGKVLIEGSVLAGSGAVSDSVLIASESTIKQIKIGGDITGTTESSVVISASEREPIRGIRAAAQAAGASTTIGKVQITGSATHFDLLAGYFSSFFVSSGDASIGSVSIGGNFTQSNIVAGVDRGSDGFWGTADDFLGGLNNVADVQSRIAKVIIKGQAAGTAAAGDHFGIVAETIGKVQIGGIKLPAPQDDSEPAVTVGWSEDVTIRATDATPPA